jgi:ArsR family transcriptional regulator
MGHDVAIDMGPMRLGARKAAAFLKALSNEHRLLILCQLAESEKSVGELEAALQIRQPHLSQHLARLRREKLVVTRRESRTIYYCLGSPEAERMLGTLYEMFCADAPGECRDTLPVRSATTQAPSPPTASVQGANGGGEASRAEKSGKKRARPAAARRSPERSPATVTR